MSSAIDRLAQEIQKEMGIYSEEVTQIVKRQADLVATEAVKELRDTSPKRTGDYAKDWAKKTGYESTRTKRNTVYNKGHYQLTHLLENGHAKRGGGRVAGTVHIEPIDTGIAEKLQKGIEGEIAG